MAYSYKKKVVSYRKSSFTREDYFVIARAEGLSDSQSKDFSKFMSLRFPREADVNYATEWAIRFKRGTPEYSMDPESLKIYNKIKEKKKKMPSKLTAWERETWKEMN